MIHGIVSDIRLANTTSYVQFVQTLKQIQLLSLSIRRQCLLTSIYCTRREERWESGNIY
jgi:hypothetical protein